MSDLNITKEQIDAWSAVRRSNSYKQEAADVASGIQALNFTLDDDLPFSEFASYCNSLMHNANPVSLGWEQGITIRLGINAMKCFRRGIDEEGIKDFCALFELVQGYMRAERDTAIKGKNRWENIWLAEMSGLLATHIDLMPVESYEKFLTNASSYGFIEQFDSQCFDNELFDPNHCFGEYKNCHLNQGFKAILNHCFTKHISIPIDDPSIRASALVKLSILLDRIDQHGIRMMAYQVDMLLIAQTMSLMTRCYEENADKDTKDILAKGISSLANIALRDIGERHSMRRNSFRPPNALTQWQKWLDRKPLRDLCSKISKASQAMRLNEDEPLVASAVRRFRLQVLTDALYAQESCSRHIKSSSRFSGTTALFSRMSEVMTLECSDQLHCKNVMAEFPKKSKSTIISFLPEGELKKELLLKYSRARGEVLSFSLGL